LSDVDSNTRQQCFRTFVGSFAGACVLFFPPPLLLLIRLPHRWGLTIGGIVLDSQLQRGLPSAVASNISRSGSSTLAYALIPPPSLELRLEVQDTFAGALGTVWLVLARSGVCPGAGRGCIAAHRAPSSVIHPHALASPRRPHYPRASSTAVLFRGAAAGELPYVIPPLAAAPGLCHDALSRRSGVEEVRLRCVGAAARSVGHTATL
jgi:hypothetical protein